MKQYLTGDTLANDARMRRSLFRGAFLFVEGDSDRRLYGMFVDQKSCQLIISFNRANVIDATAILKNDAFSGALGIIDSDFHCCPAMAATEFYKLLLAEELSDENFGRDFNSLKTN